MGERHTSQTLKNTRRQKATITRSAEDRLPPHSPEAETGVLGCILLSPQECMAECIEKLTGSGAEFYDLRNLTIWESLLEMYDAREEIDVITLQANLKKKDMLDQVGGIQYLSVLPDAVPSAANLPSYLAILVEKYLLRRTVQIATEALCAVYDSRADPNGLLDRVENDFIKLRDTQTVENTQDIKTLIQQNVATIEDYNNRQGTISGLSTGFTDLDKMTFGFQPSEMIVIAARPSMGKTSLLLNIAENIVIDQKLPVGIFSLEMAAPALTMRMLCSRARVNLRNVREGFLAERDYPKLINAAGKLANAPLYIDDTGAMTLIQLRSKARRMVARYGIKFLGIDYLQLLRESNRRSESRQQEVSAIARGIKNLAKELKIPICVLSQLNREVEREKSRKPRMSDLRESGEIENAADVIGFLYSPLTEEDEDQRADYFDSGPVNLLIGKQRNGPTGEVNLTFLKSYTRFESAAKVSDDDYQPEMKY